VEGLFVEHAEAQQWVVMLRSNGRLHGGDRIELLDRNGDESPHGLELVEPHTEGWTVTVHGGPDVLDHVGLTPLPPYILKARHGDQVADDQDRAWYQTVYADPSHRKSVAAPTAGLHFTDDLLTRLAASGIGRIDVTLHVGPGTFRPITAATLAGHTMHAEHYLVEPEAIAALGATTGRVIAVGTTAVRTLESLPDPIPLNATISGCTDLLIAPPYQPRNFSGLLTNFHLPRSTLMALVGAVIGIERLKAVYAEAVQQRYRFYSYGDAMLILP
jgi:S-adenosylmethionine:tRNA ribosyltransferase-isomerase